LKRGGTEGRNPNSRGLDCKSTFEVLRIVNREDAHVAAAVRRELPRIAKAVDAIVKAFRRGGRLIYVGAGTSGRLAVLDAAECPPTFGTSPKMVQACIAGGAKALRYSVEGAEDSAASGARDLLGVKITSRDAVVGIAASGATPYVLGALHLARQRGAITIGVTSSPKSALAREAQIAIVTDTGPEVIAGSTRLKAGTAQKMVLNLLSTASMVQFGRIYDNWMIHMAMTNHKLCERSMKILEEAAGVSSSSAKHILRQTGDNLPLALVALKSGLETRLARKILAQTGGDVRKALELAKKRRLTLKGRN
jgi:N-acetylmuramic acid 6-phosphate etherase